LMVEIGRFFEVADTNRKMSQARHPFLLGWTTVL